MKFLVGVCLSLGLMATALAAEVAPPEAVVTEMYQTYYDALNAADAAGSMDNMPDVVGQTQKYAAPELAARLAKIETHPDPVIDWDFLVNGQDFKDLKLVSVKVTSSADGAATVRVDTTNFEQPSETDVLLTQTPEGWKVTNMVFWPGKPEMMTLDDVLKAAGL